MNDDTAFLLDDDLCGRPPGHEPHKFGTLVDGSIRHPLHCSGKPVPLDDHAPRNYAEQRALLEGSLRDIPPFTR